MLLDQTLEAENLFRIATEQPLTEDLLTQLDEHPAAYGRLRAWISYVRATGEQPLPPEPGHAFDESPTVHDNPPPAKRSRKETKPRRALMKVGAVLAVLLAVGAGWAISTVFADKPETVVIEKPVIEEVPVLEHAPTVVASGDGFVCSADGPTVTCLGRNDMGQLGSGLASDDNHGTFTLESPVTSLVAGKDFACATTDQSVVCWGDNRWRQAADSDTHIMPPTPVAFLSDKTVTGISAGDIHACAIVDGRVFCWGSDYSGQLTGSQGAEASGVVEVTLPDVAQSVIAARFSTCAQLEDQSSWCWGSNNAHRISQDDSEFLPPTRVYGHD